MYCKKCGAKIAENAKFCVACGAQRESAASAENETPEVDTVPVENAINEDPANSAADISENVKATVQKLSEKASQSSALQDGGVLLKKYFSANPVSSVSGVTSSKSSFGFVALAVNIIFFAFVSCHNIAQMINHICNGFLDQLIDGVGSANILAGVAGNFVPDVHIGALYPIFGYLALLAVLVFAIEFVAIYIPMVLLKKKPDSLLNILNLQGVASFPLTAALVLNFIIGFVYPPLAVCLFVAALCLHINIIYEGLKTLPQTTLSPMWSTGIVVFLVLAVLMILIGTFINSGLNQVVSRISQYVGGISDLFGGLFG